MNNNDNSQNDVSVSVLYKMLQNLGQEVQRLHDKNSKLEEEMRMLRASSAISKGSVMATYETKNYIAKKDMESETSAINYFNNLTSTFGNTLDEPDSMNRQR